MYPQLALLFVSFTPQLPHHTFRTSWKVLETWRSKHPPQQAPTVPQNPPIRLIFFLVAVAARNCKDDLKALEI